MSAGWLTVLAVGAATIAIKAAGPVLLGGQPPAPVLSVVALLPAALLAALVAVLTFQADGGLVVDGRVVGVAVGAVAIWRGVPVLLVVILAGAATAVARAFGVACPRRSPAGAPDRGSPEPSRGSAFRRPAGGAFALARG